MARDDNSWMDISKTLFGLAQQDFENKYNERKLQAALKQQEIENQIALLKEGYIPYKDPVENLGFQPMQGGISGVLSPSEINKPYIRPEVQPVDIPGMGKYTKQTQVSPLGSILPYLAGNNGIGVTGATLDPVSGRTTINLGQTSGSKIKEQASIAQAKEREISIGKANRLERVGNRIKEEWFKTSPYKGAIVKTGIVPLLGLWDVIKKGAGATNAQRQDQAYVDFINGVRAQLAKGMGDVGNLAEQEQKAVLRLVPTLMDSYESGILKFEKIAALVEDIRKTRETRGYTDFTIEGKNYRIPQEEVEDFMKDMGINEQ